MATKRYVKKSGTRRWEVLEAGHRRSQLHAATKKEAIARARKIVRRKGGGEVRIVNRIGKIVAADTVEKSPAKSTKKRR